MRSMIQLVFALLLSTLCTAQKQGNIWYFGNHAGLSFNGITPTATTGGQTYFPSPNQWNEGTSSICDSSGTLLFYSNGARLWNRDHEVTSNGMDLAGHPSSTHAALFLPLPDSDSLFLLFTTDASENGFALGLRYSVINSCLDGGRGGIIPTEKNILLQANAAEKLSAVQHANGTDYWVVGHERNNSRFWAYHISSSGVVDSVSTSIGPADVLGWGGQITFSPDGGSLAYAYPSTWGSLSLYDFDNSTGILSNARTHNNSIDDQSYGVGFSPDGRKLYVTTTNHGKLYQYDLAGSWTSAISGRTLLAAENPDSWRDVKLGPDGRVYVSRTGRSYLSRIEQPNSAGAACQYVDQAIPLGGPITSFGLPTHVAAYSYQNAKADCLDRPIGLDEATSDRKVYYEISSRSIVVQEGMYGGVQLSLFDINGRLIISRNHLSNNPTTVALPECAPGVYFFSLNSSNGYRQRGRILVE